MALGSAKRRVSTTLRQSAILGLRHYSFCANDSLHRDVDNSHYLQHPPLPLRPSSGTADARGYDCDGRGVCDQRLGSTETLETDALPVEFTCEELDLSSTYVLSVGRHLRGGRQRREEIPDSGFGQVSCVAALPSDVVAITMVLVHPSNRNRGGAHYCDLFDQR